jgi:hypothetical protein
MKALDYLVLGTVAAVLLISGGRLFAMFVVEKIYIPKNKSTTLAWVFFSIAYRNNYFGTYEDGKRSPRQWENTSLIFGNEALIRIPRPRIASRQFNSWDSDVIFWRLPWLFMALCHGLIWILYQYIIKLAFKIVFGFFQMFVFWDKDTWKRFRKLKDPPHPQDEVRIALKEVEQAQDKLKMACEKAGTPLPQSAMYR